MIILLEVMWLRFKNVYQENYRKNFIKNWQPVLVQRALGENAALPALGAGEIDYFLILWLHFQESLLGAPREHLNTVMQELNLSRELKKRLHKGSIAKRMVAISSFGYLRDESAWNELVHLVQSPALTLSILSASALANINPQKAVPVIFPIIAERRDWPAPKIARILKESPEILASFLQFIEKSLHEKRPYLIRLLRLMHVQNLNQSPFYIRDILEHSKDSELILAALKLVREPRDLDLVRKRLRDESWQVKVQAVKMLGQLGDKQDVTSLVPLLSSKDWWLRYRAASAINAMPFLKKIDFEQIKASLTDKYAREMFEYASVQKDSI